MSNVATTAKVKASIEIIHNFSTFSTIIFPVILQNSIILIDKYIKYYDWTISLTISSLNWTTMSMDQVKFNTEF